MIEDTQEGVTFEKPKEIRWNNICYLCEESGILLGSVKKKVENFIYHECVKRINDQEWIVKPIPGYNKTTHHVRINGGKWECSCQSKLDICSHAQAVRAYNFMLQWNGGQNGK